MIRIWLMFFGVLSVLPAGPSAMAQSPATDDPVLPTTLSGVWLKTPGKKLAGDLILTADGIEFDSRKRQLFLPFESIDMVGFGRLPGDVDTDWAVLRVVEDGLYRRYALRDGRRFGYGKRTGEIYELVRRVMRMQAAGQFAVAPGYRPFDLFDTQFATEFPVGWSVTHQDLIEADRGMFFGRAVLAPQAVAPEATKLPAGAILLHRRAADSGMTCEGFGKRGLEALERELVDMGLAGVDIAAAGSSPLGGCAGLLVPAAGSHAAELRIAADGVTLVVLELRNAADLDSDLRAPFDHALQAFQFAWGY